MAVPRPGADECNAPVLSDRQQPSRGVAQILMDVRPFAT